MQEIYLIYSVQFAIYALSGGLSFLLCCIGVSYLRSNHYHRYDSLDFVDDKDDKNG